MNIPYLAEQEYMDSLDVDDIGNVCIAANNDNAEQWFLRLHTYLGWTAVETFGPVKIGENCFRYSFYYNYSKFEFNEKKIFKILREFLNQEKRFITQAVIISDDEFMGKLNNIEKFEED